MAMKGLLFKIFILWILKSFFFSIIYWIRTMALIDAFKNDPNVLAEELQAYSFIFLLLFYYLVFFKQKIFKKLCWCSQCRK